MSRILFKLRLHRWVVALVIHYGREVVPRPMTA